MNCLPKLKSLCFTWHRDLYIIRQSLARFLSLIQFHLLSHKALSVFFVVNFLSSFFFSLSIFVGIFKGISEDSALDTKLTASSIDGF